MSEQIVPTERFHCPTCESPLPHEAVIIRRLNGGRFEPAKQQIHLHCEHCRCVAEVRRSRAGGIWQLDSFTPIHNEKDRVAILDRLEKQRARLQMEAA